MKILTNGRCMTKLGVAGSLCLSFVYWKLKTVMGFDIGPKSKR